MALSEDDDDDDTRAPTATADATQPSPLLRKPPPKLRKPQSHVERALQQPTDYEYDYTVL